MLSILIFIIILGVLILVHELGHFLVAKASKIRVDEFGVGYPPRAATLFSWRGTKFTFNWIPFGGFVKIFGENPDDAKPGEPEFGQSFTSKPRPIQALVLVAGVAFNVIFAWILISLGFMVGLPTSTSTTAGEVQNPRLVITTIMPNSPAGEVGLKAGDVITQVKTEAETLNDLNPENVSAFIGEHGENEIIISYSRGEETGLATVTPREGLIDDKKAIGISMDMIGTLRLPFYEAFVEGARITYNLTILTAVGIVQFIADAFRGSSDLSQVTGPVGIVGLVGDASKLGLIYLLSFTAFISINLAVINLIPFPALDGGRLLFVIIESIKRTPINPKIANTLNAFGFVLLIGLMILVTIQDVIRLW